MNYTEIKNLALSYADRSDNETNARMDDFLKIVESRINRIISTRKMTSRATIVCDISREYYGLPPDYDGLRDIEVVDVLTGDTRRTPSYISPEQMNNAASHPVDGLYYIIIADQLQITPKQDNTQKIEIVYYKNLPPLTIVDFSNWLSEYHPDCYVFGLVTEISAFVKDLDATTLWDSRFKESIKDIQTNDDRDVWSGTSLQVRVG